MIKDRNKKDDEDLNKFIILIKILNASNTKFIWNIQFGKIFEFFMEKKERLEAYYINFKKKIEREIIKVIAQSLENSFSCKMSEDIIYDNILFTFYNSRVKSGFGIEIKSKGINDYLKKLKN